MREGMSASLVSSGIGQSQSHGIRRSPNPRPGGTEVRKHLVLAILSVTLLASCGRSRSPPTARVPPASVTSKAEDSAGRIAIIESSLNPIGANGQVRRGESRSLVQRMEHYRVPGVSIAVIDDYQTDWAKGYGVLEAGGRNPVTTDTLFHAGSVSKPLSAVAALTLVEKGLLDLDANVNDRLVSWRVPEGQHTRDEKVTLRRLLSHSAGLADGFTSRSSGDPVPEYLTPAGFAPSVTLQQLLYASPGVDVDGPTHVAMVPGTHYRYSNADYAVVQLLVEDITHKPYAEYMVQTILGPLEMSASMFEQPLPVDLRGRATTEHSGDGQPIEGERLHFPGSGLWTTPSDLARFAREIMLAYQGRSERIVSHKMAVEMLTPQIATPDEVLSEWSGLGFHLHGEGKDMAAQHSGGTWGSTCLLWFYPQTGQGAVVMTNSASSDGIIRPEILLAIAAEYDWPLGK